MPFQILFALAVVVAIFVVLRAALRLLTQPNPLVHDAISLMRWLILILVSLLLVFRFGLDAWRVIWK